LKVLTLYLFAPKSFFLPTSLAVPHSDPFACSWRSKTHSI